MNRDLTFGQLIKEHRKALDLTQGELARRVGCATITLRKIEYDVLRPSVQIAERLAMALNIPLEERGDFVRFARTALLSTPEPPPTPTPPPLPEEIGEEDLTGRAVRGYELGERIGSGGFGAVYRAVQPGVEREVAVKIILPQYANHPDFVRRFEAEAHLVARLEHPHIVPLYDYWREPNAAFLVMRLLRGGCLTDPLKNGPLPLDFVLRILTQIGGALHTAHRYGVIHRDLKPANILLDEDQNAYLADFGIAKNLGSPNLEDQTQGGAWVGSPAYISPEQIRSESILPQADIYCMGVMLYELLAGQQPFKGPTPIDYIVQHLNQPLPPLADCNPNAPAALNPIIQRATAKNPHDRYPDMLSLLADVNAAVGVQSPAFSSQFSGASAPGNTDHWTMETVENPFKGLRPFREADADDFFGRESLTQELLGRLAEEGDLARFLAVVGPSGSGKSSVVKAGLIPAIRRGALPGSENWFVVDFLPGAHPLEELEAALLRIAVNPPESLLGQLREDARGLVRSVKRILPEDPNVEVVLVIDQFEEVFTLVQDEAARAHFLESLLAAVLDERSRLHILLTLRADFTDRPLQYVDFGELLRQRTEFVLPLTPDELELAITGPAKKAGLLLEPGLTARIVRELGEQPGTLPLLQYALTELFERRDGRKLTLAAYDEIGGVLGALGRRAEDIYAGLDEPGQAAARQLFLRLVTLGEGVEDTRRRVLRSELASLDSKRHLESTKSTKPHEEKLRELSELSGSKLASVIEAFGKARLLTFDRDPVTRGPTVEVAHEALLREWPRLRVWLTDSRTDVRMQRSLGSLAAEWQATQDASFLLRGARLNQFASWGETTTMALTNDERAFLEASLQARQDGEAAELVRQEREHALEQRSRNFLRGLVGVFAVATAVALFLSIFAFNQRGIAQSEANIAATERENAQEQANLAATNAAQALSNADLASTRQAEAETEAFARATAEANAIAERETAEEQKALAEEQAGLAFSRELVSGSIVNMDTDPELSILLALQALEKSDSIQAQSVLHDAVQASHLLQRISGQPDEGFYWLDFSPDSTRLAIVSSALGWHTQVRDAESLDVLFTVPGAILGTWKDADRLYTFDPLTDPSLPFTVMVWDFDGNPLSTVTLPILWQDIYWFDISSGLAQIALSTRDGFITIYDAKTGESLQTWGNLQDTAYGIVLLSPDGTRLVSGSGDKQTVTLWDTVSGKELITWAIPRGEYLPTFAFSPDGEKLAYTVNYQQVILVDMASGQELWRSTGQLGQFRSMTFSQDGALFASGLGDGVILVWDIVTGERLFEFRADNSSGSIELAFSPDGKRLVTSTGSGEMQVWGLSPADSREWLTVPPVGAWCGFAYSPDGKLLAVANCDRTISLLDANSGQLMSTLTSSVEGLIQFPTFNPNGTLLAASKTDNTIIVWEIATGQEIHALSGHTDWAWDVAFSPDGTRLATIAFDQTARLWDVATGEMLFVLEVYRGIVENGVPGLAFSPDGSRLATAEGTSIKIWDTATGKELLALAEESERNNDKRFAFSVGFSPDGTRLAVGFRDGFASVWDATTGKKLFDLSGHTGGIGDIAYSPDGTQIATASVDGTARLWDAITGLEQSIVRRGTGYVTSLAFSQNGTRLAVQLIDGMVRVYELRLENLVDLALSRLTRWFTPEECLQYLHTDTCPPDIRP